MFHVAGALRGEHQRHVLGPEHAAEQVRNDKRAVGAQVVAPAVPLMLKPVESTSPVSGFCTYAWMCSVEPVTPGFFTNNRTVFSPIATHAVGDVTVAPVGIARLCESVFEFAKERLVPGDDLRRARAPSRSCPTRTRRSA